MHFSPPWLALPPRFRLRQAKGEQRSLKLVKTVDVVPNSIAAAPKVNAAPAEGTSSTHLITVPDPYRWCGVEYAHCRAPICQIDFGPACDANIRPKGPDTKAIARPKVGNVPYGKCVYTCKTNGVVALTFDDGPWETTEYLLDLLAVRISKDPVEVVLSD